MDALKQKNRRIFISFSSSFLLFIIIPILVLNIAAWQAIKITGQNERQNYVRILSDGRDKMDNRIKSIQSITALLRVDNALSSLERLNGPVPTEDYYYIWLALRSIGRMELVNHGWDMIIYCRNPDLVLSPTFMAGYMSSAYGAFFRFGNNTYTDFLSSFVVNGNRPVFFPAMEYVWESVPLRGLLYGLRLWVSGDTSIFFLLREQHILDLFSPIFSSKGALHIYDSSGRLLFSQGGGFPPENLRGELPQGSGLLADGFLGPGIISAYSRSEYGLLYVSAQEADAVLNHVRILQNLTLILNITAVFLSLGYAVFLAARSSRQVSEAFQLLDETPNLPSYEGGNILRYLNNAVSRLVNTNTLLQKDAISRYEMLQMAILQRIFVLPSETEQKLINQLQNADFEGARNSIHVMFTANLHEDLLGKNMLIIFYTTLQGCLLRALEGPLMDLYRDAIQSLDFHRSSEELEEDFTDLARRICMSFEAEYSKKNTAIKKEELIAYVEEHFGEERLSLHLAARHFGFSEPYFSQMFKDITGENFSTIAEITRLRHAQTLLKQYLKVEEVAYRCGYKSPGTFRRAYKRYFGINPARSR